LSVPKQISSSQIKSCLVQVNVLFFRMRFSSRNATGRWPAVILFPPHAVPFGTDEVFERDGLSLPSQRMMSSVDAISFIRGPLLNACDGYSKVSSEIMNWSAGILGTTPN